MTTQSGKCETKPVLEFTEQVVRIVSYRKLESFVRQIYKDLDYDFVTTEECGNDSCHCFEVDGRIDLWESCDIQAIREGEGVPMYSSGLLLNVLAADGYIPLGDYIVEVCW